MFLQILERNQEVSQYPTVMKPYKDDKKETGKENSKSEPRSIQKPLYIYLESICQPNIHTT